MTKPREDLYRHLDIPRESTDHAIRQAARRKSKETHPDAGGSSEEFQLTQTALRVLTDPKRRAHYDSTGDIADQPIDNRQAQLAEIICQLFDTCCALYAKQGREPDQFDVAEAMRELCRNSLTEYNKQRAEVARQVKRAEKMVGRFKRRTKKADNLLDRLMRGRIDPYRQKLRQIDELLDKFNEVAVLLKDYTFSYDEPQTTTSTGPGFFHVQMMR